MDVQTGWQLTITQAELFYILILFERKYFLERSFISLAFFQGLLLIANNRHSNTAAAFKNYSAGAIDFLKEHTSSHHEIQTSTATRVPCIFFSYRVNTFFTPSSSVSFRVCCAPIQHLAGSEKMECKARLLQGTLQVVVGGCLLCVWMKPQCREHLYYGNKGLVQLLVQGCGNRDIRHVRNTADNVKVCGVCR